MTMRWWAAQAGIALVLALAGAFGQATLNVFLNAHALASRGLSGVSTPLLTLLLLPRWFVFVVVVMWVVRRALRAMRAARKRAG